VLSDAVGSGREGRDIVVARLAVRNVRVLDAPFGGVASNLVMASLLLPVFYGCSNDNPPGPAPGADVRIVAHFRGGAALRYTSLAAALTSPHMSEAVMLVAAWFPIC
jgi:hypothetical protein